MQFKTVNAQAVVHGHSDDLMREALENAASGYLDNLLIYCKAVE